MTEQERINIERLANAMGESVNAINQLVEVFRESCKQIDNVSEILDNIQVAKNAYTAGVKARNVIPANFYKNKTSH
ncbi:hypothetical protein [Myroides odoratimimus]|uniref:Uncharacterized protein n=1 Tax=Myroides odoratimimus CIP 101113 TaxID=883154 RepID=A0AAV3F4Y1_9FLAO|nr:hypothetical protein [Myroides odoratimimus]EHO13825.1 hypothetical protein HMPREF9715_00899 [Myroides odoratimimus CIP 101113]